MITKSIASAAALGVILFAAGDPAAAQAVRFDSGLLQSTASPLVTQVQFRDGAHGGRGGPDMMRHGGGRPGMHGGGGRGGQHFGGGDFGGRHRGGGYGVGAGIAGLAAGAIIGGAIASQSGPAYGYPAYGYEGGPDYGYAPPPPPAPVYADADPSGDAAGYCAQRYKSYDPSSGTYLGFDGLRHPCP